MSYSGGVVRNSNRSYTGTVISNAEWRDVYLYSPSGYGLWDTAKTTSANAVGQTEVYGRCVSVNITNKWYKDSCTIDYSYHPEE